MPSPVNYLPVYGPGRELLYNAPLSSIPRLLDSGRVRALGTKRQIRALVAVGDSASTLRQMRPPTGQRYSHDHETPDNPPGVWTFRRLYAT